MNIRRRISIGGRPFFVATVEKHLATGSFHHVPQLTWWLIHIVRKCSSDYGRGICQRSVHVRITWVGKSSAKIIIVSIIVITKITNHYSSLSSWKTHRDSSTCTHIGPQRSAPPSLGLGIKGLKATMATMTTKSVYLSSPIISSASDSWC